MNSQSGMTDEATLTQAIEAALQANPATSRYPIEVAVQGATVSLFGNVDSQADKETAEQTARGVGGIVDVTNELVIDSGKGRGFLGIDTPDGDSRDAGPRIFPLAAGTGGAGGGPGTGAAGPIGAIGIAATDNDLARSHNDE